MTKCPKCSHNYIHGPFYVQSEYGGETLKYRCGQCGYERHEPTHDNPRQKTPGTK